MRRTLVTAAVVLSFGAGWLSNGFAGAEQGVAPSHAEHWLENAEESLHELNQRAGCVVYEDFSVKCEEEN